MLPRTAVLFHSWNRFRSCGCGRLWFALGCEFSCTGIFQLKGSLLMILLNAIKRKLSFSYSWLSFGRGDLQWQVRELFP